MSQAIGCAECGHIACVCRIKASHDDGCKFRLSATCAIPIECEHGYDVCPTCDPCTCSAATIRKRIAADRLRLWDVRPVFIYVPRVRV